MRKDIRRKRAQAKLQLSRETLRHLNDPELTRVAGGESVHPICPTETCSVYRAICVIFG